MISDTTDSSNKEKQMKKKLEAKSKNRIIVNTAKKQTFNKEFMTKDDRFKQMFQSADFKVNKSSDEYLRLHPSEKPQGYRESTTFEGVG